MFIHEHPRYTGSVAVIMHTKQNSLTVMYRNMLHISDMSVE